MLSITIKVYAIWEQKPAHERDSIFKAFLTHFQVIDETLSPTWDELLIFEEVLVYGRREDIKANPPSVIIEIYDQDKVSLIYILIYKKYT